MRRATGDFFLWILLGGLGMAGIGGLLKTVLESPALQHREDLRAQIQLGAQGLEDFLEKNWDRARREGEVGPGILFLAEVRPDSVPGEGGTWKTLVWENPPPDLPGKERFWTDALNAFQKSQGEAFNREKKGFLRLRRSVSNPWEEWWVKVEVQPTRLFLIGMDPAQWGLELIRRLPSVPWMLIGQEGRILFHPDPLQIGLKTKTGDVLPPPRAVAGCPISVGIDRSENLPFPWKQWVRASLIFGIGWGFLFQAVRRRQREERERWEQEASLKNRALLAKQAPPSHEVHVEW